MTYSSRLGQNAVKIYHHCVQVLLEQNMYVYDNIVFHCTWGMCSNYHQGLTWKKEKENY